MSEVRALAYNLSKGIAILLPLGRVCVTFRIDGYCVSAQIIHNNNQNIESQLVKFYGCVKICHDTNNIQQRKC